MDISSSAAEGADESGNKSEDSASYDEEEIIPSFEINDDDDDEEEEEDEDDDDDEDGENFEEGNSDNNDDEKDAEDLLLAMGAGCSEKRNDLPKFNLQILQKAQDAGSPSLAGGLDILNFNSQLSKSVVPGSSKSENSNESTCLFLNNIYQTLLQQNLTQIQQKLAENQEKQNVLVQKLKQARKGEFPFSKPRKNVFCIPYFHRRNNEPKPNAHTKILQTWHTDRIIIERPWTNNDHEHLVEAVHENVWEMSLKPFLQRLEIFSVKMMTLEDEEEKKLYEQKIEDTHIEMEIVQEKDIDELVCEVDDDKIDWLKICNLTFNGKHSDFSCHLMWKNWLHPRLNKTPWKEKETEKLKGLVELHGRHQWKLIAEELETNRTPFHCLQHYRRKLDAQVKREWTEEEDKILKEVIEMCRIGDNVPWNQVSFYMEGRSADHCGKRWGSLNPAIKRGRWTTEEDSLLLAGVEMLGTTNWARIRQLVPGRTTTQCRERWINCLDPSLKTGAFTYDEDKALLTLVKEHGPNWCLIASMIPGRTDASCRRQIDKLKRWESGTEFVSKQSDESKTFFIDDFDVKHFADLVQANKKTLDQLFPLQPYKKEIELILKNQPQILKRDLVRQELDRRKGEIFVPRPQNLRNCSNNMLVKLWENRQNLRKNIEDFIQKQMIKKKERSPIKTLKGSQKYYTTMSSRLDRLKPNTSVTEMLEIARSMSDQTEPEKPINKRHQCADVDRKIKSLLYNDWLKEEMEDQPKLSIKKSKASCQEEKFLDRLEGMTLVMTALGLDRDNLQKKILGGSISGPLRSMSFMTAKEIETFKEEFLLISEDPQCSGNFSGQPKPMVGFSETVPPNIHSLSALRMLLLEKPRLEQSAELYQGPVKKNNESSDESGPSNPLAEKVESVKKSIWYQMLRAHFRSVFMWPALLSTLSLPQRLDALKPYSKKKSKKKKRVNAYPMSSTHNSKKRRKPPPKDGLYKKPKPNPSETTDSGEQMPQTRSRGRPHGAVTKNRKVYDSIPQRASSRQRGIKACSDPELSTSQQSETTSEQALDKQIPSSSPISEGPGTSEVGPAASAQTKDLLANLSSDLVQQVISQEVQVKQVGTYVSVPLL